MLQKEQKRDVSAVIQRQHSEPVLSIDCTARQLQTRQIFTYLYAFVLERCACMKLSTHTFVRQPSSDTHLPRYVLGPTSLQVLHTKAADVL